MIVHITMNVIGIIIGILAIKYMEDTPKENFKFGFCIITISFIPVLNFIVASIVAILLVVGLGHLSEKVYNYLYNKK